MYTKSYARISVLMLSIIVMTFAQMSYAKVMHIKSKADYEKAKRAHKLAIIDFSSATCSPCKQIAPVFKKLSDKYASIGFYKVETNDAEVQEVVNGENIEATPTFVFYKNGKKVTSLAGADETRLENYIEQYK